MTQKLLTAEGLLLDIQEAEILLYDICKGGHRFVMSAPVREGDSDMVIGRVIEAARLYLATLDAQPTPDTLNQSTCLENTINKSDNLKVTDVTLTPLDRWHTNSPTPHDH